jgi:EmrB/QacA subfamily drug resistance transporter
VKTPIDRARRFDFQTGMRHGSLMPSSVGHPNQRRIAAVVVVLAVFMTNLDLWIVNVALPAMAGSFASDGHPASLGHLSWVLNAYAIALAALLVVAGRLGDRVGQRPVFIGGVVVFTLASLACALAPSLWVLVLARVVQAVGAAAQLPTSLALLLATVPLDRRTGATRTWAAVGGLAAAAGPVLGGLLVQVDWRWVFVVNLPIGVLTVVTGLAVLPKPAARETGRLPDIWGAVLVTIAVAALSGALVQAPDWGWNAGRTVGLLALAAVTAAWFGLRCARHVSPLLELHLLRLPRFGFAGAGTFVFGVAFAIMLLSNVLWCQDVWHWSALRTGAALVPGPALVPIVTVLTARLVRRTGHGPLVVAGGIVFAAAMGWRVLFVSASPDYLRDLLPSMILGGVGVGLAMGTLVAAGVQSLPADRAATGSAMVNSLRQISATLGVSILVTIIGSRLDATSIDDFRLSWTLAAALSLATSLLGGALMRSRTAGTPTTPHEPVHGGLATVRSREGSS